MKVYELIRALTAFDAQAEVVIDIDRDTFAVTDVIEPTKYVAAVGLHSSFAIDTIDGLKAEIDGLSNATDALNALVDQMAGGQREAIAA